MRKTALLLVLTLCIYILAGCSATHQDAQIAATTLPVYEFTTRLCQGTDITIGRVVTESVSCLHDYTLQVSQMRMIEGADAVVISGAGLEEFLEDALTGSEVIIDASAGTHLHNGEHHHHHDTDHNHETDPHIWLSPENAQIMVQNICNGLTESYPQYQNIFEDNKAALLDELTQLQHYGEKALSSLSTRELITFHDGFGYFAEAFGLTILRAVEEESGSEASASELIELVNLVRKHQLPAVFVEENGSTSAAEIICRETGAKMFTLNMAMSGDSYFDAMYHNIDIIKEVLE